MAAGALLGFDTESAMLAGVLRETSLALKALRIELELAWPGATWEFLCTGGDGEVLSHMLAAPYAPQLIFEGMRLMVLGGLLEP
jgi:pantothenate kinase type III